MGLEEEYVKLLTEHGLELDENTYDFQRRIIEEERQAVTDRLKEKGLFDEFFKPQESSLAMQGILLEGRPQHERWKWVLQSHQKEVERMFQLAGYKIEVPVLVAQFPTGTINAQVVAVPSGFLILVNTGAMIMINKIIKILFTDIVDQIEGKQDIEKRNLYTLEIALDYLGYGTAQISSKIFVLPKQILLQARNLLVSVEQFIIAHEYAHIFNGDLSGTPRFPTPPAFVGFPPSWQKEFLADIVATTTLVAEYHEFKKSISEKQHPPDTIRAFRHLLAAPLFFFEIDRLITELTATLVGKAEEGFIVEDHPPPFRRSGSIDIYYKLIEIPAIERAWASLYPNWLYQITKVVTGHEND